MFEGDEYKNIEQVLNYKDAEEREFSHRMKKIAQIETVPARQHLFRQMVTHNMGVLIFDEQLLGESTKKV